VAEKHAAIQQYRKANPNLVPPEGMALKEIGVNGPIFVPKPASTLSPAESARLQKEFRTARANYEGAIAGLSDPEAPAPTTAQLIQKQRNKELMQEAADQIVATNPTLEKPIRDQIQKSILHDHAIIESKLPTVKADQQAAWVSHLNALKDELGFDKIKTDDKGLPVTDPTTKKVVTIPAQPIIPAAPPIDEGAVKADKTALSGLPAADTTVTPAAPAAPVGTVTDTSRPPLESFFPPPK
jgi:hypothetical protein